MSDQLIKLAEDINCNSADLLLKNIIAPTELLTQLFQDSTNLPPPVALLLPLFILFIEFSKDSLILNPYKACTLFKFSGENIISTFSINSAKYSFLLISLPTLLKSPIIVLASQKSVGSTNVSNLVINSTPSANWTKSVSLETNLTTLAWSVLDKPGITKPALSHKNILIASSVVYLVSSNFFLSFLFILGYFLTKAL